MKGLTKSQKRNLRKRNARRPRCTEGHIMPKQGSCTECYDFNVTVTCPSGHELGKVHPKLQFSGFGIPFDHEVTTIKVERWCEECVAEKKRKKAKQLIRHLYRPEQHTHVIVRNVEFMYNGEPYLASFHGNVVEVEVEKKAMITVKLHQRKAISFKNAEGGELLEGYCVKVSHKRLTLGGTCRDWCPTDCTKHRLGSPIKLK